MQCSANGLYDVQALDEKYHSIAMGSSANPPHLAEVTNDYIVVVPQKNRCCPSLRLEIQTY